MYTLSDFLQQTQTLSPDDPHPVAQLLEEMTEAFLRVDHEGRLIYLNASAEQLLNCQRSQVLGQVLWDVKPENLLLESEYRQIFQAQVFICRDTFSAPLQKWLNLRIYPDLGGLSLFMQDQTAQKHTAERLHLFEQALAASRIGITISDMQVPEQPLIYCNPAFVQSTGYAVSEILGRNCRFLQGEGTDPDTVEYLRQCIRTGQHGKAILKNYRKDGSVFWNELRISPIYQNGKVTHYIGIQSDITEKKQAEAVVRQTEGRIQRLAANLPGMIYQFRLSSSGVMSFTYISPGSVQVCELEPEALLQDIHLALALIHPEDQEQFAETIQVSRETLAPWEWEGRFIFPSGKIKWVQAVSRPEKQPNDDVLWDGILIDISDRKQAEADIRRHLQMLDLANDTIMILNLDGTLTYWNHGAQQLYGWTKAEAINQNVHDLLETQFPQPLKDIEATCLEHGYWQGELIHKRRDGHWVTVASRWTLQRNAQGEPTAILEINNDITERKQTAAMRDRLTAILEATSDLVAIADARGCTTYLNRAGRQLLGLGETEDLKTYSIADFNSPESWKKITTEGIPTAITQGVWSGETVLVHRQGWEIPTSQVLIAHKTPDGKVEYLSMIVRDISDRKQAENALRRSEKREREKAAQLQQAMHDLQRTQAQLLQNEKMVSMGQLVAGIAHEINNPISFIAGNLDYANRYVQDLLNLLHLYQRNYPQSSPDITELAEEIDLDFIKLDFPKVVNSMQVGAKRISQIVRSLRNFSRLDEADCKWVNIHEGLESSLEILQHRLHPQDDRTEIQVIKNYADLPAVECYPSQLNQAILNLLNNAIDALEEASCNPPLWIKIQTDLPTDGFIEISIKDNGCGIDSDIKKRIFDPFFTTKPIGKGTGLGLAISYQIVVERHKGQLICNSELGVGSEFKIRIPQQQNFSITNHS